MNLDKKIEEKQKQLEALGKELSQLQKVSQEKQVEALKLDGAITVLKELKAESK